MLSLGWPTSLTPHLFLFSVWPDVHPNLGPQRSHRIKLTYDLCGRGQKTTEKTWHAPLHILPAFSKINLMLFGELWCVLIVHMPFSGLWSSTLHLIFQHTQQQGSQICFSVELDRQLPVLFSCTKDKIQLWLSSTVSFCLFNGTGNLSSYL